MRAAIVPFNSAYRNAPTAYMRGGEVGGAIIGTLCDQQAQPQRKWTVMWYASLGTLIPCKGAGELSFQSEVSVVLTTATGN